MVAMLVDRNCHFYVNYVSKFSFVLSSSIEVASHAVVFRGLVLPPPHKRLLTQAPHSFPIVLLPKHPSQLPSRYCLMTSNQIAGYNGRFRFPRALYSVYSLCLIQSWEMRELSWNIYIFFRYWNGWSWLKHQNKYRMWIQALLVQRFDTAGRVKIFGKV